MKILAHSESHIVKLSDGSVWQIYPGDIDLTLGWLPTTELQLFEINDHVASHGLINCDDGCVVRVRPPGERWPEERVKSLLKQGQTTTYDTLMEMSAAAQAISHLTDDHMEGVDALLEKRAAVFKGA